MNAATSVCRLTVPSARRFWLSGERFEGTGLRKP